MLSVFRRIVQPKGTAEFEAKEHGRAIAGAVAFRGEFSFGMGVDLVLEQHPKAKDVRIVRVRYARLPD